MKIQLKSDAVLKSRAYIYRLACAYNEDEVSRRELPDLLSEIWEFEGVIYNAEGWVLPVFDIDPDTIFRTDQDPSGKWFSDWKKAALAGPKQSAQNRVLPRIRTLVIGMWVLRPDLTEKYDL